MPGHAVIRSSSFKPRVDAKGGELSGASLQRLRQYTPNLGLMVESSQNPLNRCAGPRLMSDSATAALREC